MFVILYGPLYKTHIPQNTVLKQNNLEEIGICVDVNFKWI